MYFNSLPFLAFMACVLVGYYALQVGGHTRAQNRVLLVASYGFYGCFDWRLAGLLAVSTLANFVVGAKIHGAVAARERRIWLLASLSINLGILGFFKYFNFFAGTLAAVFGRAAGAWTIDNLILPVGISFYTFQTLSYSIDIYRRRFAPVQNAFDFALFVVFFPQLIMGPIERAKNLVPQILKPRVIDSEKILSGGWLIFLGLYKKVFIADQLAPHCADIFAVRDSYAGGDVAVGAFLFTIQIYADFSGYTDIARGCARLLGFELMANFRAPYLARNVQEFWNRWHISLTTWIRDYVYFPLAISTRFGKAVGAAGLAVVTMTIMGFWHGAGWMFVTWGIYHGVLLAIFAKARPLLHHCARFEWAGARLAWRILSVALTFALVAFGELLFRPGYNDHATVSPMEQSARMIRDLFSNPVATDTTLATFLAGLQICALLVVFDIIETATGKEDAILAWPLAARRVLQAFMLYGMIHALADHDTTLGEPFMYLF